MNKQLYKILAPKPKLTNLAFLDAHTHPEVNEVFLKADSPYLHWEQFKYKNWILPEIFPDKESFWFALKVARALKSISTPIKDEKNNYFKINVKNYAAFLHTIDKEMAGNFMGITDLSENDKKRFVARNIIEESIASSQLEGANTSRAVAKKMLLEGRKPKNYDEQMIVNNHKTMMRIEQELYKEELSLDLIYELHAMITEKTLEESSQGKLRETFDKKGERLVVNKPGHDEIAYITPDKEFVEAELPRLIKFANKNASSDSEFIHPLIKGIMLHFWIGLLHPFEDGNGRLARILFYWYMLKNEYWAFAYVSISEKIKKSPSQYAMAYIYSEQDNNDLTYFLDYNIRCLKSAREEFQKYIKRKLDESRSVISTCQKNFNFNERQIKLLQYLNKNPEGRTNLSAHQELYNVNKNTAIADLKMLCKDGFLTKKKQGRNTYYYPTEKISKIFK